MIHVLLKIALNARAENILVALTTYWINICREKINLFYTILLVQVLSLKPDLLLRLFLSKAPRPNGWIIDVKVLQACTPWSSPSDWLFHWPTHNTRAIGVAGETFLSPSSKPSSSWLYFKHTWFLVTKIYLRTCAFLLQEQNQAKERKQHEGSVKKKKGLRCIVFHKGRENDILTELSMKSS